MNQKGENKMENFYLFVLMCIFLIILPGPDIAIATKNTVTFGKIGGLKTALGIVVPFLSILLLLY